jgi:hypothetical protein
MPAALIERKTAHIAAVLPALGAAEACRLYPFGCRMPEGGEFLIGEQKTLSGRLATMVNTASRGNVNCPNAAAMCWSCVRACRSRPGGAATRRVSCVSKRCRPSLSPAAKRSCSRSCALVEVEERGSLPLGRSVWGT